MFKIRYSTRDLLVSVLAAALILFSIRLCLKYTILGFIAVVQVTSMAVFAAVVAVALIWRAADWIRGSAGSRAGGLLALSTACLAGVLAVVQSANHPFSASKPFETAAGRPLSFFLDVPHKGVREVGQIAADTPLRITGSSGWHLKVEWDEGHGWISYDALRWSRPTRLPADPTKPPLTLVWAHFLLLGVAAIAIVCWRRHLIVAVIPFGLACGILWAETYLDDATVGSNRMGPEGWRQYVLQSWAAIHVSVLAPCAAALLRASEQIPEGKEEDRAR